MNVEWMQACMLRKLAVAQLPNHTSFPGPRARVWPERNGVRPRPRCATQISDGDLLKKKSDGDLCARRRRAKPISVWRKQARAEFCSESLRHPSNSRSVRHMVVIEQILGVTRVIVSQIITQNPITIFLFRNKFFCC